MTIWTMLTALLWAGTFLMLPTHANGFWSPKAILWLLGSFGLVSSNWWDPSSRLSLQNKWMGFLFLWLLFIFGWKVFLPQLILPNSTERVINMPWNTFAIIPMLCAMGSFLAIDALVRHTDIMERWTQVATTLCVIAGVLAFYGFMQWCFLDPFRLGPNASIGYLSRRAMITTFGNPMLTANFLAICAPLCLMFRPWWFKVIYFLILIDLLIIHSTASLCAILLGSLTFFILRKHWLLSILLVLASIGGFVYLCAIGYLAQFFTDSGRYGIWKEILATWYKYAPWTGIGIGAMEMATTKGIWTWASAHNEFIQILFETGLIGLVLSIAAIVSTSLRVLKSERTVSLMGWLSSAIAFGVIASLSFPLRIGAMLMVGVCIWAALEAHTGGEYGSRSSAQGYPA